MRILWAFLLSAVLLSAARPPRSECTKETRGRLWPTEANAGRAVALDLMRSGEVYVCSWGRWRYRWEPLSVNVKTLEARHARPNAGASKAKTDNQDAVLEDTP